MQLTNLDLLSTIPINGPGTFLDSLKGLSTGGPISAPITNVTTIVKDVLPTLQQFSGATPATLVTLVPALTTEVTDSLNQLQTQMSNTVDGFGSPIAAHCAAIVLSLKDVINGVQQFLQLLPGLTVDTTGALVAAADAISLNIGQAIQEHLASIVAFVQAENDNVQPQSAAQIATVQAITGALILIVKNLIDSVNVVLISLSGVASVTILSVLNTLALLLNYFIAKLYGVQAILLAPTLYTASVAQFVANLLAGLQVVSIVIAANINGALQIQSTFDGTLVNTLGGLTGITLAPFAVVVPVQAALQTGLSALQALQLVTTPADAAPAVQRAYNSLIVAQDAIVAVFKQILSDPSIDQSLLLGSINALSAALNNVVSLNGQLLQVLGMASTQSTPIVAIAELVLSGLQATIAAIAEVGAGVAANVTGTQVATLGALVVIIAAIIDLVRVTVQGVNAVVTAVSGTFNFVLNSLAAVSVAATIGATVAVTAIPALVAIATPTPEQVTPLVNQLTTVATISGNVLSVIIGPGGVSLTLIAAINQLAGSSLADTDFPSLPGILTQFINEAANLSAATPATLVSLLANTNALLLDDIFGRLNAFVRNQIDVMDDSLRAVSKAVNNSLYAVASAISTQIAAIGTFIQSNTPTTQALVENANVGVFSSVLLFAQSGTVLTASAFGVPSAAIVQNVAVIIGVIATVIQITLQFAMAVFPVILQVAASLSPVSSAIIQGLLNAIGVAINAVMDIGAALKVDPAAALNSLFKANAQISHDLGQTLHNIRSIESSAIATNNILLQLE